MSETEAEVKKSDEQNMSIEEKPDDSHQEVIEKVSPKDTNSENGFKKWCQNASKELKECVAKVVAEGFAKSQDLNEVSAYIEREMNRLQGVTWHCIVGHDFGTTFSGVKGSAIGYTYGHNLVIVFKAANKSQTVNDYNARLLSLPKNTLTK